MRWLEVKLVVPESLQECVANRLFELGAGGVDESMAGKTGAISAFFEESRTNVLSELKPFLASLETLYPALPKISVEQKEVEPVDWGAKYKEFYKAQHLSPNFFLRPLWDKTTKIPDGMFPIVMDPSQAFGTGLHATTKLSMRWNERLISSYPKPADLSLLDIGTGTGILAIAAEKMGVGRVKAIEIDLPSIEVAKENISANGCQRIELSEKPLQTITEQFTLVVANILLETHGELIAEYRRVLAPHGHLILSGVLGHQLPALMEKVSHPSLVLEGTTYLQEWAAVCFTKWE